MGACHYSYRWTCGEPEVLWQTNGSWRNETIRYIVALEGPFFDVKSTAAVPARCGVEAKTSAASARMKEQ